MRTEALILKKQRKLYFVLGCLLLLIGSSIYSWSLFVGPLVDYKGWSLTDVVMAGSVAQLGFGVGNLIGGELLSRVGSKAAILTAGIMLFAGMYGTSVIPVSIPWLCYLSYGIVCGGAIGICYNIVIYTLTNWYPEKSGSINGIPLCFYGGGSLLLGPVISRMITGTDVIVTFRILAVLFGGITLLCGFLFRDPPAEWYLGKDKESDTKTVSYPLKDALRTRTFWAEVITVGMWPSLFYCLNPLWVEFGMSRGMAYMQAAALVSVMSAAQIVSRLGMALLVDKIGDWKCFGISGIIFTVGVAFLLFSGGNTGLLIAGVFLFVAGYAPCSVYNTHMARVIWGPVSGPVMFGMALFGVDVTAIIVPRIGLMVLEATGSYSAMILFGAICSLIGLAAVWFIRPITIHKNSEID